MPTTVDEVWFADTSIPEAATEFNDLTTLLILSSEDAG